MAESTVLESPGRLVTSRTSVSEEIVQKAVPDKNDQTFSNSIVSGSFVNADGLIIVTRCWKLHENTPIKAILFVCHGLAEHAARYDQFAKFFNDADVIVFSQDHVGHGRSEGERSQINDFNIFSRDVIQHILVVYSEYHDIPLFLFGHSMGSLIAVQVILQQQKLFQGLLLSGMALKPDPNLAGPATLFFGKMIAWIAPSFKIQKLPPNAISRDEEEVRKYLEDPLVYTEGIKAGLAANLLKSVDMVLPRLGEITLPCLVYHGAEDTLTFVGNSHVFFNAIQSEDKLIKIWPGARHELHNEIEPDRTEILNSYVAYIQQRI